MRIPRFLLTETVTIEPFEGGGFDPGSGYGEPFSAKAHVEPRRRNVVDRSGNEVVSEATMYFDAGTPINPEDRVTWDGRQYNVIEARAWKAMGRESHVEAVMR